MPSWLVLRSGRKGRQVLGALVASIVVARSGVGQSRAISNGIEALARHDVAAAAREFERAAQDTARLTRSVGERWLGHIAWLALGDTASARIHLERALIGAPDSTATLVERARLLGFQHRYKDAAQVALDAMKGARDAERRGTAVRAVVMETVDGAFAALEADRPVADSVDLSIVREAFDTLKARVDRFPGRTSDALVLLDAAILLDDRPALEAAWESYFSLMNEPARDTIERIRARMEQERGVGLSGVVHALDDTRLYEQAALFIATRNPQHGEMPARWSDLLHYGQFVHRLRSIIGDYYRRAIAGRTRPGDLERLLNGEMKAPWATWLTHGSGRPFSPGEATRELVRQFRLSLSFDHSLPIPELHAAHVLVSFAATPPPGIGGGTERYIVLDGQIDNGLDAWLLDGSTGRAGWVSRDSIFELRTAFTEAPFRAWTSLTDPASIIAERERIRLDSIADVGRATADSSGYLPGVAARLVRDGASQILVALSRGSLSQVEQRNAFLDSMFNALTQSAIELHESRHLADARARVASADIDAEFRAKLDEVTGSPHPKLALSAIVHPSLGEHSPHGGANRRIMVGLIRWMRAHTGEIKGYDATLPPLTQLPLLSDVQMRAAFESLRVKR